jgi:ribosomal protein S18 acetylase RimI-like enzyme
LSTIPSPDARDGSDDTMSARPSQRAPALEFTSETCTELSKDLRTGAVCILIERFGKRKENIQLVKRIFGEADGNPHCYHSKREFQRSDMRRYQCAVAIIDGECVAAACFRHVSAPRRAPPERSFTELLLLAVTVDHERRGIGGAMYQYVTGLSSAQTANLIVRCATTAAKHMCAHSKHPHI